MWFTPVTGNVHVNVFGAVVEFKPHITDQVVFLLWNYIKLQMAIFDGRVYLMTYSRDRHQARFQENP